MSYSLHPLVALANLSNPLGEQGKVDESMREMAAIEALKTEKSDKEVCFARRDYLTNTHTKRAHLLNLAGAPTTHRYLRCFGTSKTSCLRRLWGLPVSVGFR